MKLKDRNVLLDNRNFDQNSNIKPIIIFKSNHSLKLKYKYEYEWKTKSGKFQIFSNPSLNVYLILNFRKCYHVLTLIKIKKLHSMNFKSLCYNPFEQTNKLIFYKYKIRLLCTYYCHDCNHWRNPVTKGAMDPPRRCKVAIRKL